MYIYVKQQIHTKKIKEKLNSFVYKFHRMITRLNLHGLHQNNVIIQKKNDDPKSGINIHTIVSAETGDQYKPFPTERIWIVRVVV